MPPGGDVGRAVVVEDMFGESAHVDVSLLLVDIPPGGSATGVSGRKALPNVELEGAQVDQAPNVAHTGKSVRSRECLHRSERRRQPSPRCFPPPSGHLSVVMHVSEASTVRTGARKLHSADVDVLQFVDERLSAPASVPGAVYEKKSRCSCHALDDTCRRRQRFGRLQPPCGIPGEFRGFRRPWPFASAPRTETAYPAEGTLTCGRTLFDVLPSGRCVFRPGPLWRRGFHRQPMVRRESGVDGFHELLVCEDGFGVADPDAVGVGCALELHRAVGLAQAELADRHPPREAGCVVRRIDGNAMSSACVAA